MHRVPTAKAKGKSPDGISEPLSDFLYSAVDSGLVTIVNPEVSRIYVDILKNEQRCRLILQLPPWRLPGMYNV